MAEDTGNNIFTSQHDYISGFEGPYNPLNLRSVKQLSGSDVELAVDPSGRKYVVRGARLAPETNAKFELTDFIKGEMEQLGALGVNSVDFFPLIINLPADGFTSPALKIVTNYVDGHEVKEAPWEMRKQVVKGVLNYYKEKINSKVDFVIDILKSDQYRYGSVKNGEKKVYLVDIDLDMNSRLGSNSIHRETREHTILYQIRKWIYDLSSTTRERMETAELAEDFIKNIDPATLSRIKELRNANREYESLLSGIKLNTAIVDKE